MKFKAVVPRDHRIEIALPPEVPEGPVELEVTIAVPRPNGGAGGPDRMLEVLADLREFRKQFIGKDIRLSDAVIEMRREED